MGSLKSAPEAKSPHNSIWLPVAAVFGWVIFLMDFADTLPRRPSCLRSTLSLSNQAVQQGVLQTYTTHYIISLWSMHELQHGLSIAD